MITRQQRQQQAAGVNFDAARAAYDQDLHRHVQWHQDAMNRHGERRGNERQRRRNDWVGPNGIYQRLERMDTTRSPCASLQRIRRIRQRWKNNLSAQRQLYQKFGGYDRAGPNLAVRPPLPRNGQQRLGPGRGRQPRWEEEDGIYRGQRRTLWHASAVVYAIYNNVNKKVYVGVTSKSPLQRFAEHVKDSPNTVKRFEQGQRQLKHGALHRAMHRYGFENFGVTVLEYDDQVTRPAQRLWHNTARVRAMEKHWVHRLDAVLGSRFGYTEGEGCKYMTAVPRRGTRSSSNRMTYLRRRHEKATHPRTGMLQQPLPKPPPPQLQPPAWVASVRAFIGHMLPLAEDIVLPATRQEQRRRDQLFNCIATARAVKTARALLWLRRDIDSTPDDPLRLRKRVLVDVIEQHLGSEWTRRVPLQKREKRRIIVTVFTHPDFDSLQFSRLLNRRDVRAHFPQTLLRAGCQYPMAVHSYPLPLRHVLFNFGATSRRQRPPVCMCHRAPTSIRNPLYDGHVMTTEYHKVPLLPPTLAAAMSEGTKARTLPPSTSDEQLGRLASAIATVKKGLTECIDELCIDFRVHPQLLLPWKEAVQQVTVQRCLEIRQHAQLQPHDPLPPVPCDQNQLRRLQRSTVITYADKAPQTFVCVCAAHYCHILKTELERQDSPYEQAKVAGGTPLTDQQLLTEFREARPIPNLRMYNSVPTLVANIKTHKATRNAARVIASAGRGFNTPLAILIDNCLSAMVPMVHKLWFECFSGAGVFAPNAWFIKQSADVLNNVDRHLQLQQGRPQPLYFRVYDFPSMYTTLEHDDLFRRLGLVIDMVFDLVQRTNAHDPSWNNMTASIELGGTGQKKREDTKEWKPFQDRTVNDDDKKVIQVSRQCLKGLIRYFVSNVYVTFGGQIYRQRYGIPMGANCSPLMANFYLFHCEYEHATTLRLMVLNGPAINAAAYYELEHMAVTSRMIDDIITVDYNEFDPVRIYPAHCRPTLSHEGHSVPALDMQLSQDGRGFYSRLFDKRRQLGLTFRRFPALRSVLSDRCKYGVMGSQVHRFMAICTRRQDQLKAIKDLANEMIADGYLPERLRRVTYGALTRLQTRLQLRDTGLDIDWFKQQLHDTFHHAH